jgi:hypothetical protein
MHGLPPSEPARQSRHHQYKVIRGGPAFLPSSSADAPSPAAVADFRFPVSGTPRECG